MPVYHFSEEANIEIFHPRTPVTQWAELGPVVWAVDEWHAPIYTLPRNCPRVCFYPLPTTTPEDYQRFFSTTTARMVIAVESAWLERIRSTVLYRYTLPDESFSPVAEPRYYQVSKQTVVPLKVDPVGDLLQAIATADVELRICPSITELGRSLTRSTLQWSLIRMKYAQGWISEQA